MVFRPEGRHLQVSNDARGIVRLVRMLMRSQPQLVVLEAGGGYEAGLFERLAAKQLPAALLNPRHVRQFARASGRLAKTDAIDAEVLAHFAEVMKPEPRRKEKSPGLPPQIVAALHLRFLTPSHIPPHQFFPCAPDLGEGARGKIGSSPQIRGFSLWSYSLPGWLMARFCRITDAHSRAGRRARP